MSIEALPAELVIHPRIVVSRRTAEKLLRELLSDKERTPLRRSGKSAKE